MRQTTLHRVVAAGATLAIAAATMLVMAPAASAAPLTASITAVSATPTIFAATADQAVGDWEATVTSAVSVGDTLAIQIDDGDATANCAAVGDTVGFASVPTVAVAAAPASTAAFTAAVSPSPGACATAGVNDILTLTASADGPAPKLNLSNIRYTVGVGTDVGPGPVMYSINGGGVTTTNTNAVISAVRVTGNNPATLSATSTLSQAIPDITLEETYAGAVPAGNVCVNIITVPTGTGFDITAVPTVTAPATGATTPPAVVTANTIEFTVSTATTAAGTYTISGIKLNTAAAGGPVDVEVGAGVCGTDTMSRSTRIGFVGDIVRTAGANRYATAQKIAETFGCLATVNVVIARGDNFPDALAASYLAGKNGSPILLTQPDQVPDETSNVLRQQGVKTVTIIGGTGAISTAVEDALKATAATACGGAPLAPPQNIAVTRIEGPDRYATARAVAEFPGLNAAGLAEPGLDAATLGDCGTPVRTAFVASGENFPDALAAGGLAYSGMTGDCPGDGGALPLLLTPKDSLGQAARDAALDLGIKQVILLGGTAAVSQAVTDGLAADGIAVVRISGPNRQATAASLVTLLEGNPHLGDFEGTTVLVSRPDTFPDALAAGPLSGVSEFPLLLSASTTSLGATATDAITGYPNSTFVIGNLIGGEAALSPAVAAELGAALSNQG